MVANVIAVIVIVAILAGAITYIIKAKRSGAKCIGCPASKTCGSNTSGNSSCCCSEPENESDCCCGK